MKFRVFLIGFFFSFFKKYTNKNTIKTVVKIDSLVEIKWPPLDLKLSDIWTENLIFYTGTVQFLSVMSDGLTYFSKSETLSFVLQALWIGWKRRQIPTTNHPQRLLSRLPKITLRNLLTVLSLFFWNFMHLGRWDWFRIFFHKNKL